MTDDTITQISASCGDLEAIDLNSCTLLTDASVKPLACSCPAKEELWINNNNNITDAAVAAVRKGRYGLFKHT